MDPAAFLATQHDPSFVAASLLVATFAAYVSLDLARRVRQGPDVRWLWWLGGSIAMGTGIWSMHFIGMLGFDPGIPLVYSTPTTLLSWLAAVAAAGVALGVAMREKLSVMTALLGSSSMALGICAMHYLGMSALDLSLGLVWRVPVVLASVAVAWAASSAALLIFFGLRGQRGRRRFFLQAVSALVMGCAIGGMHYTGMAAALIPAGSVCITASGLSGQPLALLVAGATVLLLGVALLLSLIDAVAHARESRLADSLHQANTELQVANDELLRMAFADPLTGLRNRSFFDAQLRRTVATATMDKVAVVFVDLDGFKPINDSFGHETGDIVLREVAVRLGQCVRNGGTLARLGGDEFVVMLTAADARGAALAVSERMITALRRPVAVVGQELGISCSVGIAIFPDHDRTGSRLVACADAATYAAKRLGGSTCVFYEPGMGADSTERVILHQALRNRVAQRLVQDDTFGAVCAHAW
ncbi:MAG: diguanylate cyclase, partial [Comamonadaceae bacterium]